MNSSNNPRVNAIELIKVIAIISMINIHVFDSNSYYLTDIGSGLGHFIYAVVYICGGVISAGVFMFCMGWGTECSKKATPSFLLRRSLIIFVLGIFVNLFTQYFRRFLDPKDFGSIKDYSYTIIATDIYLFVITALLYLVLLKVLSKDKRVEIVTGIGIILICWLIKIFVEPESIATSNEWLNSLIGFFYRINEFSYFPFTTWIVFPALGYFNAYIYRKMEFKKFILIITITGALGLIIGQAIVIYYNLPQAVFMPFTLTTAEAYYSMDVTNLVVAYSFIEIYLSLSFLVMHFTKNRLPKPLLTISKNVMYIYIIQWIILSILYVFLIRIRSVWINVPICIAINVIAILLSIPVSKVFTNLQKEKPDNNMS